MSVDAQLDNVCVDNVCNVNIIPSELIKNIVHNILTDFDI